MNTSRDDDIKAIVVATLAEQQRLQPDDIDAIVLRAIATILTSFGIEEEDRKELRADFQHLRRWRKSVEQAQSSVGIDRKLLVIVGEGPPDDGNHTSVALGQRRAAERRLRIEASGVDEDHLVADHAVHLEDVLDRSQKTKLADRGGQLLVHFSSNGGFVRLAEFDAAADQPVISRGILSRRGVEADGVRSALRIRRDEHGLHADDASIDRHPIRLSAAPVTMVPLLPLMILWKRP